MKKFLAVILALTLLMSMSVTAFADESATQTENVSASDSAGEPPKADEPAQTDEPAKADEPAQTDEPAKADEPAKINEPCYDYTVHIPASCTIEYGNTEPQSIGSVRVTSDYWDNITTDYFGVFVRLKHNNYLSNVSGDSKIVCCIGRYNSSNHFIPGDGVGLGWCVEYIADGAGIDGTGNLYMEVFDWSEARPGESYSVTITYTSELVVRN